MFAQLVLLVITLAFAVLFPVTKREFDIVKREIARRNGTDNSKITPEEIAVCEKVTGYKYNQLWNIENAISVSFNK